jgi:hypothetical protein
MIIKIALRTYLDYISALTALAIVTLRTVQATTTHMSLRLLPRSMAGKLARLIVLVLLLTLAGFDCIAVPSHGCCA